MGSTALAVRLGMMSVFLSLHLAMAQTAQVSVDATAPGITVSPTLYGIFFEEINRAGDGGLYAEMLQNRSFEDVGSIPMAWELATGRDGKSRWALDRDEPRINATNPTSLRVVVESIPSGGSVKIVNRGFVGTPRNGGESDEQYAQRFAKAVGEQRAQKHGIAVKAGAEYLVSLYLRADASQGSDGEASVAIESSDGKTLASASLPRPQSEWKKVDVVLKPDADATDATFAILFKQPGTYRLDMVSMFPRDTFKGHRNGLRKDLAELVAAMKPAFVRFPGGCFVEGDQIEHAARWKATIGDVAARPGHWNLWGYHSTDGLGMFEYLQFCDDIGAEPLFVINVGMSHGNGQLNNYAVPMDKMDEFVQDALDGIEYCNGPASSKWGALRVAAGHPEAFDLKYIEIGNENGGPNYNERYALFHDAIKKRYPKMNLIANVWGGVPNNRPFDLKDEHYYNTPGWFLSHAAHYDKYERKGAKVYVGEYAVTQECGLGNLAAAVGEAAFMMGMERNSDVVTMASYAPLFAEPAWKRWNPNAINFDGSRTYGTPSYHLQALFANNRPDVMVPAKVTVPESKDAKPSGRFGISTWDTQTEFKDIKATDPQGKLLWQFDPAKGMGQLEITSGEWKIQDGALRQSSSAAPASVFMGDSKWTDYTITFKARKIGGREGFLVNFHSHDTTQHNWWNVGGWGNREHGFEGSYLPGERIRGSIETARWYDVKLEMKGGKVRGYLNGKLVQQATETPPRTMHVNAGIDRKAGEVIVKVVNAGNQPVEAKMDVTGAAGDWKAVSLTSEKPSDENSFENPTKVTPREMPKSSSSGSTPTFPPHSVTVLRSKLKT